MNLHDLSSPLLKLNGGIITDFVVLKKKNFHAVVNREWGETIFSRRTSGCDRKICQFRNEVGAYHEELKLF
jgi:hypothetical protein